MINHTITPKQIAKRVALLTLIIYIIPLISEALLRTVGSTYGLFLFDVDYPRNIPAIYNIFLTLSAALLALLIAYTHRSNKPLQVAWVGVAAVAGLLAIDKGTGLSTILSREMLIRIFHLNQFSFLTIYAILGLMGMGIAWQVAKRFPTKTRRLLLVWLAVKGFGLVGLWLVSGYYAHWVTTDNFTYALLSTFEEATETFSSVILLYAIFDYIADYLGAKLIFTVLPTESAATVSTPNTPQRESVGV